MCDCPPGIPVYRSQLRPGNCESGEPLLAEAGFIHFPKTPFRYLDRSARYEIPRGHDEAGGAKVGRPWGRTPPQNAPCPCTDLVKSPQLPEGGNELPRSLEPLLTSDERQRFAS